MQSSLLEFLNTLSSWVWGAPLLMLLVGTGVYLTVLLRGLQLSALPHALHLALVVRREPDDQPGDITHFQALMTALAATVGTGNIAGVATAIAAGGPGAIFWMWITGLFGHGDEVRRSGARSALPQARSRRHDERRADALPERRARTTLVGNPLRHLCVDRGVRHRQHGTVKLGRRRGSRNVFDSHLGDRRHPRGRYGRRHPRRHSRHRARRQRSRTFHDRPLRRRCSAHPPSHRRPDHPLPHPHFSSRVHADRRHRRLSRRRRDDDRAHGRRARRLFQRIGARQRAHCSRGGANAPPRRPGNGIDDPDVHRYTGRFVRVPAW